MKRICKTMSDYIEESNKGGQGATILCTDELFEHIKKLEVVIIPNEDIKQNMSEWIKCSDRTPEDRKTVLWLHDLYLRKKYENIFDSPTHIVGYYMEETRSICLVDLDEHDCFFNLDEFTYWMPLPEVPKD